MQGGAEESGASRTVPVLDALLRNGRHPLARGRRDPHRYHYPHPQGAYGSSYQKLRLRSGLEYPLVSSSVFLSLSKKGVIDRARVVVGAVGPHPSSWKGRQRFSWGEGPAEADVEEAAEPRSPAVKA